MRFLGTSPKLSELLEPLDGREPVSRFIHSSAHFTESTGLVRPAAIGPQFVDSAGRLETSVYRVAGAASEEIWAICAAHVDGPERRMRARATCTLDVILAAQLSVEPDGKPHRRHANIIDWPQAKHEQKIRQQRIASKMKLDMRPPGAPRDSMPT